MSGLGCTMVRPRQPLTRLHPGARHPRTFHARVAGRPHAPELVHLWVKRLAHGLVTKPWHTRTSGWIAPGSRHTRMRHPVPVSNAWVRHLARAGHTWVLLISLVSGISRHSLAWTIVRTPGSRETLL